MKHAFISGLLVCFALSSFKAFSQDTIRYSYDNAGNRTGRETIFVGGGGSLKSASVHEVFKDDTFDKQSIKIYPNPTKGLLEIEIPDDPENEGKIQLVVLDSGGRVIIDKLLEPARTSIDLTNHQNGLYILNIRKGKLVSQWKIIKH